MSGRLTTVVVITATLWLTSSVSGGDAGRETPFTSVGAGARAIGMGGGITSLATDATAIHYNPAGLAGLDYQEVAFMHSLLFEGSTYDFASWVYPITENHGVGGGVMRIGTDDIIRRSDFADRGRFDYAFTQLLLAYGRNFSEPVSTGVCLKIVHQSLDNNSDFGVGLDVGFRIRICRNLHLGMVAREVLQPELKLQSMTEKTPMAVSGGISYYDLALSDQARLAVNLDLEKYDNRSVKIHSGAEVRFHDRFALRLGYDRDNVALGGGLKYGRMNLDYAYRLVDYVRDIHHISISFLVGRSTSEHIRERELAKLPPEPTEAEKRFMAVMDQANHFFHRFQLDSARAYYLQALDMQPGNKEIIGTLAAIEEARRIQREQEQELQSARDDVSQTLASFVDQAERLLGNRMYRAALDLLNLIFDIDPGNVSANKVRRRIEEARAAETFAGFEKARSAVDGGRWSEAIEAYNRVLELDPANQAASIAKQQLLARMDLPEKIRLGIEMYERGNLAEARTRFEAVLSVNPNEPLALEYLRRIQESQTRPPTSTLEDLQKDRVYWELYLDGLRHMRNKDYRRAIEVWERVLQAYPNNPSTLDNIEQARLRLGTEDSEN